LIAGIYWLFGQGLVHAAGEEPSPPPEEADHFLRTPESIADLTFLLNDPERWVLSEVVFGVREGHLFFAKFASEAPDGTIGSVDESEHAEALVEDTSQLPGKVIKWINHQAYQVKGFTLGRAENGEAYMDWGYLLSPDGVAIVRYFDPPNSEPLSHLLPLCRIQYRVYCFGPCSGSCVVAGSDPCDCNAIGFCWVDFEVWNCLTMLCTGRCLFWDDDNCLCVTGPLTGEGGVRECN
jgi:hypothetical protein